MNKYDILLSDGVQQYGLLLRDNPKSIDESPETASTLLANRAGSKWGDYDPMMARAEQRTWSGGRGSEDFSVDQTKFYDSQNAWTMTEQRIFPAPQWEFGRNAAKAANTPSTSYSPACRDGSIYTPICAASSAPTMEWVGLFGGTRYEAAYFKSGTSYSADKCYMWIRRRGTPGTLTLELRNYTAGAPGSTVYKTVTKTTSDVSDTVSVLLQFDWSTTYSVVSGTDYALVVYGASTDSEANHWELGCAGLSGGFYSSAGSSWTSDTNHTPYYAIFDADTARQWKYFKFDGGLYKVDIKDSGSASVLYINGDRGKATSGTATTIVQSTKAWVTDRWIGAWVKIIRGTGMGQTREITDSAATSLTVATWSINPDSTSEFVIYSTPFWTECSTTGLGAVTCVCVAGNIVFFAQGKSVNIRRMRNNGGAHEYADDSSNKASVLYAAYDTEDSELVVWRANNSTSVTVSKASLEDWGTDLSFEDDIEIGDSGNKVTRFVAFNSALYVFKEDGMWIIYADDTISKRDSAGLWVGDTAIVHNSFLYYSWSFSLARLYGNTVDDIGIWKGSGLPSTRSGKFAKIEPVLAWLACAIDAGTGTSSVQIYNDFGYHEMFRAFKSGRRIRDVVWYDCPDARPQLWADCGGDSVYMTFPYDTLHPLRDTSMVYNHEAVVITSAFDFGSAELPKLFKDVTAITKSLTTGIEIGLDYQCDTDVGTDTWLPIRNFITSPAESISPGRNGIGNKKTIRLRFRLMTDNLLVPPQIVATILGGSMRTPLKYRWVFRAKVGTHQITKGGVRDNNPTDFLAWLKARASDMTPILVRSETIPTFDNMYVLIEPPKPFYEFQNNLTSLWGGDIIVVVREL